MKSPEISKQFVYEGKGNYLLLSEHTLASQDESPQLVLDQFKLFKQLYDPEMDQIKRKFVHGQNAIWMMAGDMSFEIISLEDQERFTFIARQENDNSINFDVELLKKKDDQYIHSVYLPRFRPLFRESIDFFGAIGKSIRHVDATWFSLNEVPLSTNYEKFKAALQNGLNPNDAAFSTVTGTLCREFGFSTITDMGLNDEERVTVRFSRL